MHRMNILMRLFTLFIIVSFFSVPELSASQDTLVVHFFGSSTCGECLEIKQAILFPLSQQYPGQLKVKTYDIDKEEGFSLLIHMEEEYGVIQSSPQTLFLPDTVLTGYENIMNSAYQLITEYLANPEQWTDREIEVDTASFAKKLEERVGKFTFLGILAAGLVDGVNPCAIATMIFLVSFLAMQKRKRREVLVIGLSFTAAVFVTYLLLGLGAFRLLTSLQHYYWISEAIKWIAVSAAGLIALVSFYDAFSYKKSKKTSSIKLQLPKALKIKIHSIISSNLSGTQLVWGAMVTGFLVTLLEAVCTGQVYIPTIVLMTKSAGFRLQGWLYLIFYNFLFVLPLLIVMIFAFYGLKWNELAKTTQKHLAVLKILLGIVLAGLAVFLAIAG